MKIEKKLISIIVPVYNNANCLEELIQRVSVSFKNLKYTYEIIFIDDGSIDNSLEILKIFSSKDKFIKIISLSKNFGQHSAIRAGFNHADGNLIILMDADLQDRPENIPQLVKKIVNEELDVVFTMEKKGGEASNLITSRLYHFIFSKLTKTYGPPNVGTFRIFNRKFLTAILQFNETKVLYGPLMFYVGFNASYLELTRDIRLYGKSAYNFSKRFRLALDSLISFTDFPHKVSTIFGFAIFLSSLIYGLLIIFEYTFFSVDFCLENLRVNN
jgi:dolichol-phosphate mannosyltransferase